MQLKAQNDMMSLWPHAAMDLVERMARRRCRTTEGWIGGLNMIGQEVPQYEHCHGCKGANGSEKKEASCLFNR